MTQQEMITELRNQLLSDKYLYSALVASIASAIYDNGTVCGISDHHNLAAAIANQIIGKEE